METAKGKSGMRELIAQALPKEALEFDAFLNEPPYGASREESMYVRDFRHQAYPKWQKALDALRAQAQAEQPAEPVALSTADVIIAILAVDREAARRGEMFPQTHDEQREDRRAVARVVGMLRWYQENTGCERIKGWPTATSRTDPRIAALEGLLREVHAGRGDLMSTSLVVRIEAALGGST